MYAIRKPCYAVGFFFSIPKIFEVLHVDERSHSICLADIGSYYIDRFILVKTLEEANKILSIIKESK